MFLLGFLGVCGISLYFVSLFSSAGKTSVIFTISSRDLSESLCYSKAWVVSRCREAKSLHRLREGGRVWRRQNCVAEVD